MRNVLLAMLALGVLLFVVGCPPKPPENPAVRPTGGIEQPPAGEQPPVVEPPVQGSVGEPEGAVGGDEGEAEDKGEGETESGDRETGNG